jgi:hypothetical protein
MATTVFGLTAANLQAKLMPKASDRSFRIGNGATDDLSIATAEDDILATAEDRVLSHLPERYRPLMTRVEGEVLTASAREGQTVLTTGLKPLVAGSLRLYSNFPRTAVWSEREFDPDPAHTTVAQADGTRFPLPAAAFAVVDATGVVTLSTGLRQGDRVWAFYRHTAGSTFRVLRGFALTYAAIEVSRRFNYFKTVDGVDRYRDWNIDADLFFKNKGEDFGVSEIDALVLVSESETRGNAASRLGDIMAGL